MLAAFFALAFCLNEIQTRNKENCLIIREAISAKTRPKHVFVSWTLLCDIRFLFARDAVFKQCENSVRLDKLAAANSAKILFSVSTVDCFTKHYASRLQLFFSSSSFMYSYCLRAFSLSSFWHSFKCSLRLHASSSCFLHDSFGPSSKHSFRLHASSWSFSWLSLPNIKKNREEMPTPVVK